MFLIPKIWDKFVFYPLNLKFIFFSSFNLKRSFVLVPMSNFFFVQTLSKWIVWKENTYVVGYLTIRKQNQFGLPCKPFVIH